MKTTPQVKLGQEFSANVLFERNVTVDGYCYLVIYGKHINGYFCCVPGFYGVEMSDPNDVWYNTSKLVSAGAPKIIAEGMARAIKVAAGNYVDNETKEEKFAKIFESAYSREKLR